MTCSRCDRKLSADTAVYSSFTGAHFCITNWDRCDRIFRKKKAAA